MLLCFEYRQHPDTGLAITYPTGHGKWRFGGHKGILAALRYKNKSSLDFMTISALHLWAGRCEQPVWGCTWTASHQPPPGTPKTSRSLLPRCCVRSSQQHRRLCWAHGVRSWIICTETICTGCSRYGLAWGGGGAAAEQRDECKITVGVHTKERYIYKYFNKECMQKKNFKGVLCYGCKAGKCYTGMENV